MSDSDIDRAKIQRSGNVSTPPEDAHFKEVDDVIVQVTQAYCPQGHNLVLEKEELFDGAPGITLLVSAGGPAKKLILSPFHGDHRRYGFTDYAECARLEISCPICQTKLPELSACACSTEGKLIKLYLTPDLNDAHVVGLCNIWGCHRSKLFDQAELLAAYLQD